jgi:RNA polymerase sigma factor (sigma-70 family)
VGASRAEIEELYRDRYVGFRRTLATITGDYESAHDVVQEAFARALVQRRRFRNEAPLGAWVWRIAIRVALDQRSKDDRVLTNTILPEVHVLEPSYDPELTEAIQRLPPRRRLIFFLRYFADLSYQEIAAICEIGEGTVAAAIAQARSAVIDALGARVADDV